jgi:hypothetical protein
METKKQGISLIYSNADFRYLLPICYLELLQQKTATSLFS